MREVPVSDVMSAVRDVYLAACLELPPDVERALAAARDAETHTSARGVLDDLLRNAQAARDTNLPLCQDTGLAVVFLDVGQEVRFTGGLLQDALDEGVRQAVRDGYLRSSVVADPLRRRNTGDNTPAAAHIRLTAGDRVTVTVAPKGFGSENGNALRMFDPGTAPEELVDWLCGHIRANGGKCCPPLVLGLGLGGASDTCMEAARRALLRPLGRPHPDPYYAALERRALAAVNATGVGPMGMGGNGTALGVHIETLPTHIAGLPAALCVSCHALRRASAAL
jgi:fumarate hydratase subunit alpha